jgi:HlyD family secretion protein
MTRTRRPRRARLLATAAAALLLAGCTSTSQPAPTVKVDRGPVSVGVSASGTLVSVDRQNLGFAKGGQITALMVKVGDVVQAGQPLARLDDAALRTALRSAEAKRDQQRASLGKIRGDNSVASAQSSLNHLRTILSATRDQVAATADADVSAIDRARVQLSFDQGQRSKAQDALDTCESATTTASPGDAGTAGTSTNCSTQQTALDTAEGKVIADQTALESAQHKQQTDAASGRVSIANAEKSVSDAQSQVASAQNSKPGDVAGQSAAVRDAQAAVDDAQRNLDAAVLKAPVAGTVSAINGSVGEFLGAAGGTTALAPGSDARAPSTGATDTAGGATGGGGQSFITLNNVSSFQLVVPFEESDAAKIAPNQKVDVTVDAVPNLLVPGTVVAVAPAAAASSGGVVNYTTTVLLDQTDPQLKDGQTAQADVLTKTEDNVLRVPSSLVRQENGQPTVDVPDADGKPKATPFSAGLVGDRYTEVVSGLDLGQDVLVPQAQVSATRGGPNQGGN